MARKTSKTFFILFESKSKKKLISITEIHNINLSKNKIKLDIYRAEKLQLIAVKMIDRRTLYVGWLIVL